MAQKTSLFSHFTLDETVDIQGEHLTSPYHVYAGTMMLFGGTVAAVPAQAMLGQEGLTALLDDAGRALAAVWVCEFTDASLGPHHELQISLFAASRVRPPVTAHRYAVLRTLLTDPDALMVCHGLWNSTSRVVRFNKEHLGLNAALSVSAIKQADGWTAFSFPDTKGAIIAEGSIRNTQNQPLGAAVQLTWHLGLGPLIRARMAPFLRVRVLNTFSPGSQRHLIADTYSRGGGQTVRPFDGADRLTILHPTYLPLQFRSDFVQQIPGIEFVYQRPQPWSG